MNKSAPLNQAGKAPRIALIAGPTASGKSALAVALAHKLRDAGAHAVIINADASQVYADIPILSARPSASEMAGIPHRLFGHVDGAEDYSAARWVAEASAEIAAASAAGGIAILVGGTGMYLSTLLDGIAPVPPIDEGVRSRVRALSVADAYARLQSADPHAATRLKPQDKSRIARALEVVEATGTPLHYWQQQREGGIADQIALSPLLLLPPRDWLRDRCDARLAAMFASGAIAEVRALLDRRLSPDLPVMRAIGVREIAALLADDDAAKETEAPLALAQAATRQYAKRQYTWFRNQFPTDWPRWTETLNHDRIDELAIKLRQSLLTG